MRVLFLVLVSCFICLSPKAQILIKNTTIVDVENKKLLPGYSVVVQNGLITAMDKNIQYKLPEGTQVIDGTGKYLAPGWVDAHVHFFQSGGLYARPDAIDLRPYKPYDKEVEWTHNNMEGFLRHYTRAGICAVIDVGATVSFLKQRDSFNTKAYAPGVYMTGPLLTTWEPQQYKGLKDDEPFYEMQTQEDARRLVQQQLPFKPDFIKIWYIVPGKNTDSSARKYLPLVKAVMDESHKAGLRVAVHATERITAQLAVEAGADYLVHGIDDELVDASFVGLLKSKKTVLCPTLVVMGNYYKVFGQSYDLKPRDLELALPTPLNSIMDMRHLPDTMIAERYKQLVTRSAPRVKTTDSILRVNLKRLLDGGVTIATGTDAGNIGTQHVAAYFDELAAMHASGFNYWQLLQSSTINGARAVGKETEFGSITKGKRADMNLLNANPLDSLANWRKIDWVINKGVAFKPDSLLQPKPEELADAQLLAYNAHDLEAFLKPYDDSVEVYGFPGQLVIKGKDQMRKSYAFVTKTPGLHCRLLNRIVKGNRVIDHEQVWGFGDETMYGVVIYEMMDGRIRKVYFL